MMIDPLDPLRRDLARIGKALGINRFEWVIRAEKPEVFSAKWESYKNLLAELKQYKGIRFYGGFGLPFFGIENISSKELADKVASTIKAYNIEIISITPYEQTPEPEE